MRLKKTNKKKTPTNQGNDSARQSAGRQKQIVNEVRGYRIFGGCLFGVRDIVKKRVNMRVTAKQSQIFSEKIHRQTILKKQIFRRVFLSCKKFRERKKTRRIDPNVF